jgi:hypothetical protein
VVDAACQTVNPWQLIELTDDRGTRGTGAANIFGLGRTAPTGTKAKPGLAIPYSRHKLSTTVLLDELILQSFARSHAAVYVWHSSCVEIEEIRVGFAADYY